MVRVGPGRPRVHRLVRIFLIPPENPDCIAPRAFDRAQLSHPSLLASERTLYALAFSGLMALFIVLRKHHTIRIALRFMMAFSLAIVRMFDGLRVFSGFG